MVIGVLVFALLAAGAEPVSGAAPDTASSSSAPANSSPAKVKGSDIVCTDEKPTGSHFPKRICMTRDQAEQAEREAKDSLASRDQGKRVTSLPR